MRLFKDGVPKVPDQLIASANAQNLDLAYISPNLAACSAPTDKAVKKIYQNSLVTLSKVLTGNHGSGNWTLMNLRTEKIGYDPTIVTDNGGKFDYRPYLDNNAIPFDEIIRTVHEMDDELSNGQTIVVHCRHGKGRTGSIIVGYLMFKYHLTFERANKIFTVRRKIYRHGVSVPSQVRYLGYYEEYLEDKPTREAYDRIVSKGPLLTIKQVVLHNLTCTPSTGHLRIHCQGFRNRGAELATLLEFTEETSEYDANGRDLILTPKEPLTTKNMDVSFQFTLISNRVTVFMLWMWVNAAMESALLSSNDIEVTIPWENMDGYRGTERRGMRMLESVKLVLQLSESN